MRKIILFFLIAAFLLCTVLPLGGARAAADGASSEVRVALSVQSGSRMTVAVEGSYTCLGTAFSGGTLTATVAQDTVVLHHSALGELARGDSVAVIRAEQPVWAAFFTLENTRYGTCKYQGDLIFAHDSYGRIVLINRVDMRAYLCGVVGGELRNSHPIEMLKAQAVAAKGFALARHNVSEPYDLTDTPADQVYAGYAPADENVAAAVDAVLCDTLLYEGEPVCCYYCTCNGGQTLTPKQRWGSDEAQNGVYALRYDPYDLEGSAAVQLRVLPDADRLDARLYAFLLALAQERAPDVARIVSILSLTGSHSADRPEGTEAVPAELAPQERADAVLLCEDDAGRQREISCAFMLYTLYERGVIMGVQPNVWFVHPEDDGSWSLVFAEAVGHRVGMSHRGMQSMAEQGFTYDEILNFYYPGGVLRCDEAGNDEPTEAGANEAAPAATDQHKKERSGGESAAGSVVVNPTATPNPATTAAAGPVVTPAPTPGFWERLQGLFA